MHLLLVPANRGSVKNSINMLPIEELKDIHNPDLLVKYLQDLNTHQLSVALLQGIKIVFFFTFHHSLSRI